MEASSFSTSFTRLRYPFSETLLSKRENFPALIKCYASPSSRKNGTGTLLCQAGFHTRKWSLLQVSCSRERDIPVIEAGAVCTSLDRTPGCARARLQIKLLARAALPEQLHVSLGKRKICSWDGCMDDIYDALAEHLVPTAAAASSPNFKHIVGLAGPPGAGKSTVASEVAKRVNKLWPQKSRSFDDQVEPPEVSIVLPMDGFHLYRHQLDAMEDPEEAHARRGAPWTFDPNLLLECLKTLKDQGSVYCPSFDHGVGDPVEDDIFVNLQHKIVIVEGNYLLLGDGAWKEVSSMFDEKWFVDVDIEKAMQRVLERHISTGKPPDVAKWRIDYNDRPNAELIMKSKKNADMVIKSIDELR